MAKPLSPALASGALFGAALASSGVWYPSVIDAQVHLRNFHMMKVFLAASATSAVAILSLERAGFVRCIPKKASNWGWLGQHDGNIIGGALLGTGMALSGACPGTVLVQIGMGLPLGLYTLAGTVLGGILYARFAPALKRGKPIDDRSEASDTIHGKLQVDPEYVLVAYETVMGLMLALTSKIDPHRSKLLHPIIGGLMVGCGQLSSLLLAKKPVGVSTAFEDFGKWFWYLQGRGTKPDASTLAFAAGMIAGSWGLAHLRPGVYDAESFAINPIRAVIGGILLAVGARVGGGCTSGHGISSMAMFSIASVISVISMFGGAFAAAALL